MILTRKKLIRKTKHIIKIIIFCWLIKLAYRIINRDKVLNSIELIESWGYPAEQHNITTDDGYILKTFRIPWSPLKLSKKYQQKPVVLMLNGLLITSDIWLIHPDRSLAKQLADEGYDVWMANYRGSTYGREHVTLSPNDKKFWDFSFHEIGYYDVPSTIDYILNTTNQSSLICIALSMGTTLSFITLSEHSEYNSKIKLVIELGAVAGFFDKQFEDTRMITVSSTVINLIDPDGTFEMFFQNSYNSILFEEICINLNIINYCLTPLYILCGRNDNQLDANIYINLLNYFPDGTSAKTLLHYAQLANYRKFQQYDYQNEQENIKHYGTSKPPQYNLKNIKSPMIFFYCRKNDPLSTIEDVTQIIKRISSKVIVEPVSDENYNHVNFVTAKNIKSILNNRVIECLDQFSKEEIIS